MQIVIQEHIANELNLIYETEDIENVINQLLEDAIAKKNLTIEDFFGKVEFVESYDYKKMRNRNENIG